MLGGAGVHPREMVKEKNFNPGNAGAVFYYDILAPLAHLGLLTAYRRAEPQEQVQVAGSGLGRTSEKPLEAATEFSRIRAFWNLGERTLVVGPI